MTDRAVSKRVVAHAADLLTDADAAARHLAARPEPTELFSVEDIANALGITMTRAYNVIRHLVKAGRAEVARPRKGPICGLWRPANRPPVVAARKTSRASEQMWAAMRAMPKFTPTALANHATVGEVEVTVDAARKYCRALMQAGYLRVLQKADRQHEAVFRLSKRSGLKAPNLRRVLAVVDDNTNETVVIGGAV